MLDIEIYKRTWPKKGYKLYSMTDDPGAIHLQYSELDSIAILMRIEWKKDTVMILAVELFQTEKDAVTWYVEETQKRNVH